MVNILGEESNTVAYKVELPDESNKWIKSVVAFCNTSGGKLIMGIQDNTLEIVGINDSRSELEARIVDTIYSCIEPMPTISTMFQNIEGKDIFILNVSRGGHKPYYIKSLGMERGTFVRFGSTDRQATSAQILELSMFGQHKNFITEAFILNSSPLKTEDKQIQDFIDTLNVTNSLPVNLNKLLEWKLILSVFDEFYATNGFMLLTSNPFNYSYVKIGIFDGTTKAKMLDEIKFEGSIIKQYENSIEYILNLLKTGFTFKKIRKQTYLIPEEAIREVVANAIIHRNYQDEHPIRIEIYSDRIVFYSPGSLYDGIQLEDILNGISKLRNGNISEVFYHLGYIEKWGSGIQRSNRILKENGFNELDIDSENIHGVTVTINFEQVSKVVEKTVHSSKIPSYDDVITYYNKLDGKFTRKQLEHDFNLSTHYARTICENLQKENLVSKEGSGNSIYYQIV